MYFIWSAKHKFTNLTIDGAVLQNDKMLFQSSSKHSCENLKTEIRYDLKLKNSRKSENVKLLKQIVSFWHFALFLKLIQH